VIAIGNAIVDVMAPAADDAIAALGLAKGGMTLVDADRAAALYAAMGPARNFRRVCRQHAGGPGRARRILRVHRPGGG
jgi:hypothetical protein